MADYGPPPLRSEERQRTNSPAHEIWKLGPDELKAMPFDIDLSPSAPELPTKSGLNDWKRENPDAHWGFFVTEWYERIKTDPMVVWMTSADWGALFILLEDLDRELKPQVVGISPASYSKEAEEDTGNGMIGGEVITAVVPMKGAKLSAVVNFLKAFGIGEANRLRMQKEIQLFEAERHTVQPTGGSDKIAATRFELLQGGQP